MMINRSSATCVFWAKCPGKLHSNRSPWEGKGWFYFNLAPFSREMFWLRQETAAENQ